MVPNIQRTIDGGSRLLQTFLRTSEYFRTFSLTHFVSCLDNDLETGWISGLHLFLLMMIIQNWWRLFCVGVVYCFLPLIVQAFLPLGAQVDDSLLLYLGISQ